MHNKKLVLTSILKCPHCGHASKKRMPTDACLFLYVCPHCHALLKPKPGDCCVFCSYGSVPCPPKQQAGSGDRCC
ncbi:MAG TPA: GDCCVxC domain-containing (seleno)protein [Gammaproteobacteria bacterium]|nr:GDCCVxC domain-containing (seleno)protein [Gammaproteobacteria bacterium]